MQSIIKKIWKDFQGILSDSFWRSNNLEYRLLKKGYLSYQYEVVKKGKTFEIFISDYIASIYNFICDEQNIAAKTTIHTKVCNIFSLRPDLIKEYFSDRQFDYNAYKRLSVDYDKSEVTPISNTSSKEKENHQDKTFDIENTLSKVREEILKYESGEKKPKHIGQRMFGYLINACYFSAYNDEQRYEVWKSFTGLDTRPEMSYFRNPEYNKNSMDKDDLKSKLRLLRNSFI